MNKVGSSVTYTTASMSNQFGYFAQGSNTPTTLLVQFTKLSPSILQLNRIVLPTNAAAAQGGSSLVSFLTIADGFETLNPTSFFPNVGGIGPTVTQYTLPYNFDSGFIYWSFASQAIEISDWLAVRIY